ncbi:MAG: hypothetical protein KAR44_12505 [Candidatus Aegiribacteria sp.]|nr:hypothetical protein [Candidatus Aegiribacteria sp.]
MSVTLTAPLNDTYVLSVADVDWIYQNVNLAEPDIIKGLAGRRFKKPSKILSSNSHTIRFAQECTRSCEHEFNDSPIDQQQYVRLLSYNPDVSDIEEVLGVFGQLWRGFSIENVKHVTNKLDQDRKDYEQAISGGLKGNGYKRARLTRLKGWKKYTGPKWVLEKRLLLLRRDRDRILELREELREYFKHPIEDIAFNKLLFRTRRRRHPILSFFSEEDDYLRIIHRLDYYHTKHHSFPLRYMRDMPIGIYYALVDKWEAGASRDDIIMAYVQYCDKHPTRTLDVVDTILTDYSIVLPYLAEDRSNAMDEIKKCDEAHTPLALVLLGVTLLEGLLWDFANLLNKRHYRIFKPTGRKWPRGHAYAWDESTGKVRLKNGKGVVDKRASLKTGRDLVGRSRLGFFLQSALSMYIISDFFDDRNRYAHADTKDRDVNADATSVLCCLMYLVKKIRAFVVDGERPESSE